MAEQTKRKLSGLRRNQQFLYIGIFTLVAVIVWVGGSLFQSQKKTGISSELQKMALPLNPNISGLVIDRLESKVTYSSEELGSFEIYRIRVEEENRARLSGEPDSQEGQAESLLSQQLISQNDSSEPAVDTADWPSLTKDEWGISFKYPPNYEVLTNNETTLELGTSEFTYITFSTTFEPLDDSNLCPSDGSAAPEGELCISTTGYNQTLPVMNRLFGSLSSREAYLRGGPDEDYHVVNLATTPELELRAYIAGGGLNQSFEGLLSTITTP